MQQFFSGDVKADVEKIIIILFWYGMKLRPKQIKWSLQHY